MARSCMHIANDLKTRLNSPTTYKRFQRSSLMFWFTISSWQRRTVLDGSVLHNIVVAGDTQSKKGMPHALAANGKWAKRNCICADTYLRVAVCTFSIKLCRIFADSCIEFVQCSRNISSIQLVGLVLCVCVCVSEAYDSNAMPCVATLHMYNRISFCQFAHVVGSIRPYCCSPNDDDDDIIIIATNLTIPSFVYEMERKRRRERKRNKISKQLIGNWNGVMRRRHRILDRNIPIDPRLQCKSISKN